MIWFLIKDNSHLGPFSEKYLHDAIKNGSMKESDFIWQEGWEEPRSYQAVFSDIKSDFVELKTVVENLEDEDLPPDLPPELPFNLANNNDPDEDENEVEEETEPDVVIDFKEYEFEYEKGEKSILKKLQILAIFFIIIVIAVPTWMYYRNSVNIFSRPQTMSLGDFERLEAVAKNLNKDLAFDFSLATDKRTLWIATNNPLQGEVYINLKSKKGKILGDDVEVKSKGYLKQGLIQIDEFQFIEGGNIVDGYYDVEIYTIDDLEVPIYQRFFEQKPKQIRYINQFLITSLPAIDFEKQLDLYSKRIKENSQKFWEELILKYETIKSITSNIREGMLKIFDRIEGSYENNIKKFENDYKTNYGLFFTSFVENNDASYEKIIKLEFKDRVEIMANYSHLSKLAEDIGAETVKNLELLKNYKFKDKSSEEIEEFQDKIILKLTRIIRECERKVAIISAN